MKPLEPAQRVRRWHTYLIVWTLHRALGLALGALILLASLTGGVLVMHKEIERLVEPGRHVLPESAGVPPALRLKVGETPALPALPARAEIAPLVRAVAAEAPAGYRPLRLMLARAPEETEKLIFVGPDGRTRWSAFVNPYTGEVLWSGFDQALFTPWLLHLHMHLHAGGWGYIVTGLSGAALFLLGLTGLYLHRDRLSSLWRRPMRFGRGARLAFTDLHRWLGIVSIYFSLVLGLTGAIYSAKIAPGQIATPKALAAPFKLAQLAPIEPALQATRARFPGADIIRIAFPTSTKASLTFLVLHRDAPVWRKFSRTEFDPVTGALRAIHDAAAATPREKFAAMLGPLHFGFYGSPIVKWLYAIGGFAPALLAASGTAIWFLRTRRKKPAVPAAPASSHFATASSSHP